MDKQVIITKAGSVLSVKSIKSGLYNNSFVAARKWDGSETIVFSHEMMSFHSTPGYVNAFAIALVLVPQSRRKEIKAMTAYQARQAVREILVEHLDEKSFRDVTSFLNV